MPDRRNLRNPDTFATKLCLPFRASKSSCQAKLEIAAGMISLRWNHSGSSPADTGRLCIALLQSSNRGRWRAVAGPSPPSRRTATPVKNDAKRRLSAALSEFKSLVLNGRRRSVNRKVQGSNPCSGANLEFEWPLCGGCHGLTYYNRTTTALQPMRVESTDPIEVIDVRPSWRRYGNYVLGRIYRFGPLALVYLALQLWLGGQSGGKDSLWELLPIAAFVAGVAAYLLYLMSIVVHISGGHVEVGTRWIPRSANHRTVTGGCSS